MTKTTRWLLLKILGLTLGTLLVLFAGLIYLTQESSSVIGAPGAGDLAPWLGAR